MLNNLFYILLLLTNSLCAQIYDVYDLHKKLFEKEGLDVRFLFYSSGNGVADNGINVLVINNNEYAISYSFDLIFKSGEILKTEKVSGILKEKEMKTGSTSNLFFLPFGDGTQIKHVGAAKIKVILSR
jgi:hypothetical protein